MKTVGELLDDLFQSHRHPSGREYTYQEVSEALDREIDPTYISKLRKGKIPNPGRNALLLLCYFFKVQPNYFFPELQPPQEDEQNQDPISIAMRTIHLQPSIKKKLEDLLRALQPGGRQEEKE